MAEVQHHHEMRHSLNADTDDLDGAKSTYTIEYDHAHDDGDKAHSHEHQSTVEPEPMKKEEAKKPLWFGI